MSQFLHEVYSPILQSDHPALTASRAPKHKYHKN